MKHKNTDKKYENTATRCENTAVRHDKNLETGRTCNHIMEKKLEGLKTRPKGAKT